MWSTLITFPIGYMAKPGGDVERNDATVFNTILWFEIDLWQIPSGVRFALDSRRGGTARSSPLGPVGDTRLLG